MEPIKKWLMEWAAGIRGATFPDRITSEMGDLICLGGALTPDMVLEAYSKGMFPWTGEAPIPWYSPDPRMILPPEHFKPSKNLIKLSRKEHYQIIFDQDFEMIMKLCAYTSRPGQKGTWITGNMIEVYTQLHKLNIGHCVGVYEKGNLVGGLYGLSIGSAFFGESMFANEPNTSKLALYALSQELKHRNFHFIDCQQVTDHLFSLGARAINRQDYLHLLDEAISTGYPSKSWNAWDVQFK